mgnify:CR=1 FL=1
MRRWRLGGGSNRIWWAYGSGVAIAIVAIVMAIASRTPGIFSSGVLVYAFSQGLAYATFSAIVLVAIGRGAASTKYAALSSLGNLPVAYMTALDGWVHDKYGTSWMLHFDALSRHCLHHRRNVRPEKLKRPPDNPLKTPNRR